MPRLPAILALVPAVAAVLVAPLSVPANAQDRPDPYAACAAIGGKTERLACFDATYARSGERQTQRAQDEAQRREREFGLSTQERQAARIAAEAAPAIAVPQVQQEGRNAARNADQSGDEALQATVAAVSEENRRAVVRLDNGQLWRERDGSTLRIPVRVGWQASITRHWSGAYEMRFIGRSGYLRVGRVE